MFNLEDNPVLTPYQVHILKTFFASNLGQQFFLTGGTALAAFYLGHRQSQDLEFFTLQDFELLELEKIIERIAANVSTAVKTKVKTSDYTEIYLENKKENWIQRLDFIKEQPIVFGERVKVDGVIIDSLENIASNKILTIYGRLEPKDYLDLYFILKETELDFTELFEKAKKKDTGLHEFYFANIIAEAVEKLGRFPKTLKPFDSRDLLDFYSKLGEKMLKDTEVLG